MRRFLAGIVAFVFLCSIMWFFWGWGAAIFIVLVMITLGIAFHYLPGYRVYFAFLIIGSILAMIVVPTVRHFIAQEFPQFRIANDRSILELDYKLSKLTDSSMVYSKTAIRSYLGSLDGILKRQLDQQLETLLQKKQNDIFGPSEAVELAQIIHRINVWGMIYEANQEAVDKGKMPTNMLTIAVKVGQYDVPLYTGDGREIVIENGNLDQVSNGKIRAGAVVKIVIPEMVRQFVGQPETNSSQQWVVSKDLSKQFQPGEVFAIVYLGDANGLPTANSKRCGWLPLSAFEAVVNPYTAPKRAVQNDPSNDWQGRVKNSMAAGEKVRWWPFVVLTGLIVAGWLACKKWVKNMTALSVCKWVAVILVCLAAWSYVIGPFGQAALAGESGQRAPTPPVKISQNNQWVVVSTITTTSAELADGKMVNGGLTLRWPKDALLTSLTPTNSSIFPCGNNYVDDNGLVKFRKPTAPFEFNAPAFALVAQAQGETSFVSWPSPWAKPLFGRVRFGTGSPQANDVVMPLFKLPDASQVILKINAPLPGQCGQLTWDSTPIQLEAVESR